MILLQATGLMPPTPWPQDLAVTLRTCHLGCVVSGTPSSGDASEDYARRAYHTGSTGVDGTFLLAEEVSGRGLILILRSAGGLSIGGDDAAVGCAIISEGTEVNKGPFTVQFSLSLNSVFACTAEVNGLTRDDIINSPVTATGTYGGTQTANFELSFI
jgi:hypothetical protein